ncbi:MAG: AAA family ATPase, partial [Candidatus Pacebacteria bacterium]|nr:AAA family ATPase [Candidatus Paceibacterota bacterium]
MDKKIYKIAITGGPCGGKSKAMSYLMERLTELGFYVIVVPEQATFMIEGSNIRPGKHGIDVSYFQKELLRGQIEVEDRYQRVAEFSDAEKIIILCDRGALDGMAYVPGGITEFIQISAGIKSIGSMRSRYDGIVHLVTAADGAEEYYTLENNTAR